MMRRRRDILTSRPFTQTRPEMVPKLAVPIRAFKKVVLPALQQAGSSEQPAFIITCSLQGHAGSQRRKSC